MQEIVKELRGIEFSRHLETLSRVVRALENPRHCREIF